MPNEIIKPDNGQHGEILPWTIGLDPKARGQLEKPMDSKLAKKRKIPGGKIITYYPWTEITDRLDDVFGVGGWALKVKHVQVDYYPKPRGEGGKTMGEVTVFGTFYAKGCFPFDVFGGWNIYENVLLAHTTETARQEAVKKAAGVLRVAKDLWRKIDSIPPGPAPEPRASAHHQEGAPAPKPNNGTNSAVHAKMMALAKELGLHNSENIELWREFLSNVFPDKRWAGGIASSVQLNNEERGKVVDALEKMRRDLDAKKGPATEPAR